MLIEGATEKHGDYQISAIDLREGGLGEWRMISNAKYKLVWQNQEKLNLYNIEKDPWENENISDKKPQILAKRFKKLREMT